MKGKLASICLWIAFFLLLGGVVGLNLPFVFLIAAIILTLIP